MDTGNEQTVDPQHVLDIAFYIKEILDTERENLFGFNILIIAANEANYSNIITRYKTLFLSLEIEERIWISKELHDFFHKYGEFKTFGDYKIITKKKLPAIPPADTNRSKSINLSSKESLFAALTPLLNNESSYQIIHFCGAAGTGKSLIMEEIIVSIYPEKSTCLVPRNHIRFKKSSPIHPLLNGVHISLLNKIEEFLNPHEQTIWKEQGTLLHYLKSNFITEKCPDQILEDFYICYNLYITAYIRMMESNLLPALFICDDLDRYHPYSIQLLSNLTRDFIKIPGFIPIFISTHPNLPEKLALFNSVCIRTNPVTLKEIDTIARIKFPQLNLDKKKYKEIRHNAKGRILPIINNLLYLDMQKKTNTAPLLPKKQEEILWYLIKNLDITAKDILYSIYISGGLLPVSELIHFLVAFGLKKESIEQYIKILSGNYLIYNDTYLVPYYPFFKQKLEKHLGKRGEYLKDLISDFVLKLWKKKKLANLVLLFSFYMNNNFPHYAFEILNLLIKRKLDENDISGVKPFLVINNFVFPGGLNQQETPILNTIVSSGKIRFHLIENNIMKAEEAAADILKWEAKFLADKFHGELSINISRFYLAKREIEKAIQNTKKNLITIQELGFHSLTGQSYKIMGYIMLCIGKIDDAIDYSDLAEKILDEAIDPYERIQVLLLGAITHFLKGNLSRSLFLINQGSKICTDCARRNFELLFNFFKARIYFEYGDYERVVILLQKNLNATYLYSLKSAWATHYAWLARVEIYRGNAQAALSILERLEINKENLYFKSEAYYFLKQFGEAKATMEKALSLPDTTLPLSDETVSWINGFDTIEGKGLSFNNDNSIYNRLMRAFYAFLQGMDTETVQGINALQAIIRTEKTIHLDPNSHFYYYLYAYLLYQHPGHDMDDSLTILNQALKQLQERASKIDNPLDRTDYLNNNLWNNQLLEEGKKRKLM